MKQLLIIAALLFLVLSCQKADSITGPTTNISGASTVGPAHISGN